MFCTKCGEKNEDNARFCGACGQTIQPTKGKVAEHADTPTTDTATNTSQTPPQKTEQVTRYANPHRHENGEETAIERMQRLEKRPKGLKAIRRLYTIFGLFSFVGIYLLFAGDTSVMSFSWYGLSIITLWFLGFFAVQGLWSYRKWGYVLTMFVAIGFIAASFVSFLASISLPVFVYLLIMGTVYGLVIRRLLSDEVRERCGYIISDDTVDTPYSRIKHALHKVVQNMLVKIKTKQGIIIVTVVLALLIMCGILFRYLPVIVSIVNPEEIDYHETYEYQIELIEQYARDMHGGATAQETLQLYAQALRSGNLEEASMYYTVDARESAFRQLRELRTNDPEQYQTWIVSIETAAPVEVDVDFARFEYTVTSEEELFVEGTDIVLLAGSYTGSIVLHKISSGVWKVITI